MLCVKKDKGLVVLSLFGGMETLRQALENLNIKVNKYYSSEIKPYAIELSTFHFPDIMHLGDINNWKEWDIDWKTIDFIGSGSPCQDLSIAGKRAGLNGAKSSLFWVFIDILNHVKKLNPNVLFLQENVGSAQKKDVGIMSRALGLYPVRINSKLVVAALRDRYYWTNIKTKSFGMFGDIQSDIPQPKDRKIYFKDIIEGGAVYDKKAKALLKSDAKTYGYTDMNKFTELIKRRNKSNKQTCNYVFTEKAGAILENQRLLYPEKTKNRNQKYLKKRGIENSFINLVYVENNEIRVKTNTVKGYDIMTENDCLNLSFPTSKSRRGRVTKHKSPCLLKNEEPLYCLDNSIVRVLSQTELERLQGFPDGYTSILTRNKAASLLGDGWTLPMIEHILSFMSAN